MIWDIHMPTSDIQISSSNEEYRSGASSILGMHFPGFFWKKQLTVQLYTDAILHPTWHFSMHFFSVLVLCWIIVRSDFQRHEISMLSVTWSPREEPSIHSFVHFQAFMQPFFFYCLFSSLIVSVSIKALILNERRGTENVFHCPASRPVVLLLSQHVNDSTAHQW